MGGRGQRANRLRTFRPEPHTQGRLAALLDRFGCGAADVSVPSAGGPEDASSAALRSAAKRRAAQRSAAQHSAAEPSGVSAAQRSAPTPPLSLHRVNG